MARVWGHPSPAEGLDLPLICDWPKPPETESLLQKQVKPAQTEYEVVEYAADNTARAVLKPITGRSHQLRVHMLALVIRFSAIVLCITRSESNGTAFVATCRDADDYPSGVWQ